MQHISHIISYRLSQRSPPGFATASGIQPHYMILAISYRIACGHVYLFVGVMHACTHVCICHTHIKVYI